MSAYVKGVHSVSSGAGTSLASPSINIGSGNFVVGIAVGFRSAGASAMSTFNGTVNNLTGADKEASETNITVSIWAKANCTSGSQTFTATFVSSQDGIDVFILEFSGIGTTKTVDGTGASATGFSATPASGNFTTSATALLIAAFGNHSDTNNTDNATAGSGWSMDTTNGRETNGIANLVGGTEYQLDKASGTYNGDFGAENFAWVAAAIAYDVSASDTLMGMKVN